MIDFTKCEVNKFKAYGGANGNKINIRYDGKEYMLKFPPAPGKIKAMSYTNGCISEYLACRDFTGSSKKLMEFAQLKNTCIDSEQNGFGTELSTIIAAIEEQSLGSCVGFFEYCADQKRDTQNEIHGHSLWPDQLIREFPLGIDDIIGKCKQKKHMVKLAAQVKRGIVGRMTYAKMRSMTAGYRYRGIILVAKHTVPLTSNAASKGSLPVSSR